jgi:hypothetical protein
MRATRATRRQLPRPAREQGEPYPTPPVPMMECLTRVVTSTLIGAGLVASVAMPGHCDGQQKLGPFDLPILSAPAAPHATARARLVFASSPFGVAVTSDGHSRYDIQMTITGLPLPSTLGHYSEYVAWAATPDLTQWVRLGTVTNGRNTVGTVDFNKFLLVLSAESAAVGTSPTGPTVLHGTSPSGYIQSFLSHPLFRGLAQ